MVPPFEVAVLADPNGAYTTSAALVALVSKHLVAHTGRGLEGDATCRFSAAVRWGSAPRCWRRARARTRGWCGSPR